MPQLFYKIKHKASGLFFISRIAAGDINVSQDGEVFHKKPPLCIYSTMPLTLGFGAIGQTRWAANPYDKVVFAEFDPAEWELIEYLSFEQVVEWE